MSWACEAYGRDGMLHGALCFVSGPGERVCLSRVECAATMAQERRRLYRCIQEQAAAGDPVAAGLAAEFTRPEQLLSGE